MDTSPRNAATEYRLVLLVFDRPVYRTEVINDQVISTR
jgi:hypothetical protein